MRLIMWTLTIIFALAGLALRADQGAWFGAYAYLGDYFMKGFFILATHCCPFLRARSYGFMPRGLQVPGKERMMLALALILAVPLGITYAQTGLVPRLPTAVLVTGLMILAALNGFTGLILDTVVRGRREVRRLAYLAIPIGLPDAAPVQRSGANGKRKAGTGA